MRDDSRKVNRSFETPSNESPRRPDNPKPKREAPLPPRRKRAKGDSFFLELVKITIVAMLVVLPLRMFVAQPFIVAGSSMQPTFDTGDYLIVEQLSYEFNEPERKDVVVFRYPNDPSKFFIKRIIGLPGETVEIEGSQVTIKNSEHPEGFVLDEPYVISDNQTFEQTLSVSLDNGGYFVMGDNRRSSSDSRAWGELPSEFVVGQAFFQILPVARASVLPGSMNNVSTDASDDLESDDDRIISE